MLVYIIKKPLCALCSTFGGMKWQTLCLWTRAVSACWGNRQPINKAALFGYLQTLVIALRQNAARLRGTRGYLSALQRLKKTDGETENIHNSDCERHRRRFSAWDNVMQWKSFTSMQGAGGFLSSRMRVEGQETEGEKCPHNCKNHFYRFLSLQT